MCKVDRSSSIAAFYAIIFRIISKLTENVKLEEISGHFRYLSANRTTPCAVGSFKKTPVCTEIGRCLPNEQVSPYFNFDQ